MKSLKSFLVFKIIIILSLAVFLTGLIFIGGCGEVPAKKVALQLSVDEAAEILKAQGEKYTLLDVRTREEFDSGHLDSAILIPVEELEARYGELLKDKPIIVYCRSGRRSAEAAAILVSKGFSQVYDMTGGINAWTSKGYPVVVENVASANGTAEASNSSENTALAGDTSDSGTSVGDTPAGEDAASVEVRYVTADELNSKVTKGEDIIILDVRSEDSFAVKHIVGALNIPYTDLEGRTGELDSLQEIIIYCSNYDCGLSTNAVTLLTNSGFKNVFVLEAGIESWQEKGYPVE